jgi:hypothetical protein
MNGTCQTCGTVAPIEWFLSETEHRQLCGLLIQLPKDIEKTIFHYLSLFRPVQSRAIQAKKATRLLTEIKDLVATGYVQIDKKVARPCPPRIWAQAMEQMIERRDRLSIPMPNHNYLKTIAYDLADHADSKGEQTKNVALQYQRTRPEPAASNPVLDPLEKARQKWDAEHGTGDTTIHLNSIKNVVKGMD